MLRNMGRASDRSFLKPKSSCILIFLLLIPAMGLSCRHQQEVRVELKYVEEYLPDILPYSKDQCDKIRKGMTQVLQKAESAWPEPESYSMHLGDQGLLVVNSIGVMYELKCKSFESSSEDDWAVLSGGRPTYAIKKSGHLYCLGSPKSCHLESESAKQDEAGNIQIGPDSDWTSISASSTHACAIKSNGTLHCWGENESGQLGDGTKGAAREPKKIGSEIAWTMVSVSFERTCAISDTGALYCWGHVAVTGEKKNRVKLVPTRIGNDSDWTFVATGWPGTCAVKTDGRLFCWGADRPGKAKHAVSNIPVQVGKDKDWAKVSCSKYHTCALKQDGTLYCWGSNHYGQLGDASTEDRESPFQVGSDRDWIDVAAAEGLGGVGKSCAVKRDGRLFCWGYVYCQECGLITSPEFIMQL